MVGENCGKLNIETYPMSYTIKKRAVNMLKSRVDTNQSQKGISKRSLEKSKYSIVKKERSPKSSLEKSRPRLIREE